MSGNLLVDSKTFFPPVTTVFMVTKFLVIAMKAVIISLDLGNSRQLTTTRTVVVGKRLNSAGCQIGMSWDFRGN